MRFDDVWMQPWQTDLLAKMAYSVRFKGEAIEIGTHQGLSAIPIANAIHPRILHVVDHWQGSTDFRDYMRDRDNYRIFADNIAESTKWNVSIHKQDWHDFAEEWSKPIGFLHLDAEHTKDEVSSQIGTFLPYMARGSILVGDDYNWPGVHDGIAVHLDTSTISVVRNKLWWVTF
jgi:predicted O-methyltransferase YrrM